MSLIADMIPAMGKSFERLVTGYQHFRKRYATGDQSVMEHLAQHGQHPETMVVACSDSRVDPALILQCDPGDLFTVRNVANIIPPYQQDHGQHGVSAALEYGICYLKVKHLVILGHSCCGGIQALQNNENLHQDDFISDWVNVIDKKEANTETVDTLSQFALSQSYQNALNYPWIQKQVSNNELTIHRWFFDIEKGEILTYDANQDQFISLT